MFNIKLTALTAVAVAIAGTSALPALSQEIEPSETESVPVQPVMQAADEAHVEVARSLISQLGPLQSNGDIFYATFATSAVQGFQEKMSRSLTDSESQQLYSFWYEKIQTALTSADLEEMLVATYVRNFTQAELIAISQFYQTPAGLKWQSSLPTLQQELTAISSSYVLELSSDNEWINNTLSELLTEIPSLADSQ